MAEAVLSREVFVQYGRLRTVSNEVQATVPRQYANSFAPNLIAAYISKYNNLSSYQKYHSYWLFDPRGTDHM